MSEFRCERCVDCDTHILELKEKIKKLEHELMVSQNSELRSSALLENLEAKIKERNRLEIEKEKLSKQIETLSNDIYIETLTSA